MDPKLVELGLLPTLEAAKAQYISYFRNGLMTQLKRIEPGKNIEQAHMRNRQLISRWCYEHGKEDKVIEKIVKDGKTFYHINDFDALRNLLAQLLAEVQRIKSEGDYKAGRELVESYAVQVDPDLHAEVLERFEKLDIAPYSGFVNPTYEVIEKEGKITDIKVHYDDGYAEQMMYYSEHYSFLPNVN
jgi:dipeptidyl-peptidase-3